MRSRLFCRPFQALTAGLLFAVGALAAAPAAAQTMQTGELAAMVDRLNSLEQDLRDLQAAVYAGGPDSDGQQQVIRDPAVAQLSLRLNELERALSQLVGQVEELSFEIRQQANQSDQLWRDFDARLRAVEGGGMSPGGLGDRGALDMEGGPAEVPLNTPVRSALDATTPEDADAAYELAQAFLLNGDLDQAQSAFTAFLEDNPDHRRAGEAQHWLGEIYMVEESYARAAAAFMQSVRKDPEGARAAESWLKLGVALFEIGEAAEACRTLQELPGRYPEADRTVLLRAEEEAARACAA